MAAKRGIELLIDDNSVAFYKASDDSEPMFFYSIQDGGLFFKVNVWLAQEVKEELPYWIKDEKQLKQVIKFLGAELHEC